MFRVFTKNSVYAVKAVSGGFEVKRQASTYGQRVVDTHAHFTPSLDITLGKPMVTTSLRTTPVLAILPA